MAEVTLVTNRDVKEFIDYISTPSESVQISELIVTKTINLSAMDCWNKTGTTVLECAIQTTIIF